MALGHRDPRRPVSAGVILEARGFLKVRGIGEFFILFSPTVLYF